MVNTLLNLCKVACESGLLMLPNYKQSETDKPRSNLHTINLTHKLGAGIIYTEVGSWKLLTGKEKICISQQKIIGSC